MDDEQDGRRPRYGGKFRDDQETRKKPSLKRNCAIRKRGREDERMDNTKKRYTSRDSKRGKHDD